MRRNKIKDKLKHIREIQDKENIVQIKREKKAKEKKP